MGWKKEIFYLHSFLLLLEDGKILMQAIADDLAIAQWIETQNSLPKLFLFYGATVRCLSLVSRSLDSSRSSNLQFRKSGSVVN